MDKAYGVLDKAYSEVANRRGGAYWFSKFFRLLELIRTLRLLIVMRRNIDQDVFTPELLYFQFCLSKTPISHLFEAFLPDIIHLLALSVIVLLWIKADFSILKVDFRSPRLSRPPSFIEFKKTFY